MLLASTVSPQFWTLSPNPPPAPPTVTSTLLPTGVTEIRRVDSKGNVLAGLDLRAGVTLRTDAFRDQLLDLSAYASGQTIDVISGYRSQARQSQLVQRGNPAAARTSQHTVGLAADIAISGATSRQTARYAYQSGLFTRVNLYTNPRRGVHVDQKPGTNSFFIDWVRQSGGP